MYKWFNLWFILTSRLRAIAKNGPFTPLLNIFFHPLASCDHFLWGGIRGWEGMSSQLKRGTKKVVTHASMVVQTGEREASLNAKYWIDENTNIFSIEVCIICQNLWRRSTGHVLKDLIVVHFPQFILHWRLRIHCFLTPRRIQICTTQYAITAHCTLRDFFCFVIQHTTNHYLTFVSIFIKLSFHISTCVHSSYRTSSISKMI